jgi:prephenate dehydrogenase
VWQSILSSNRDEIRPLLKSLASELSSIADALDDREAVASLFERANHARNALK